MAAPIQGIIDAIENGEALITRRVAIYESDGTTLWVPNGLTEQGNRLVSGSVTLDYSRDERRTLDVKLLNDDNALRPNAYANGFWYDKVIKVYRGVRYYDNYTQPKIVVVDTVGSGNAPQQFRSLIMSLGFTDVTIAPTSETTNNLLQYDVIISYGGSTKVVTDPAQLLALYNMGKKIVTIGTQNGSPEVPMINGQSVAGTAITWGLTPTSINNPLSGTFTTEAASPTAVGKPISSLNAGAVTIATYTGGGFTNHITASIAMNGNKGRWLNINLPNINGTQAKKLTAAGIKWMTNYGSLVVWETQIGEFVIDRISEANFPFQLSVTGRDYTKKCMGSKFEHATSFDSEIKVTDLIKTLALNSGITKFRLQSTNDTIGRTMSIERGTPRWDIMKQAAAAANLEIYFDNEGYLVTREFSDPSSSAPELLVQTGPQGNLVTYERSAEDSRIYNHIVVYGDPADGEEDRLPYFGEAKNTDAGSPTRIERIGDRYYSFASQFFTNDQQCQAYAESLLRVHALESFDMNMSTIYYPWVEVGTIVEVIDPKAYVTDPTRFLLVNVELPLDLGPMSMVAKRITIVGDAA
jgi:hypothetical protein